MYTSTDDMKSCIEEWFAQALSFDDLRDIYFTVRSEADKQFVYMVDSIIEHRENKHE